MRTPINKYVKLIFYFCIMDIQDYDLSKLTSSELTLLNELLSQQTLANKHNTIKYIDVDTPTNYIALKTNYDSIEYSGDSIIKGCKGVVLEGGARSRKTYSFIDLLIYICLYCVDNKTIIILRDTYNSFHTTLFTDMEVALNEFGLHNPFKTSTQVSQMKIRENRIHFKGADNVNNAHGAPSYLLYFNEMLTIPKKIFDNYVMRCSHMWVGDFNPSVTEHYVFTDIIPRRDVLHVRTTFLDNPQCPPGVIAEIKAYEPFAPGSYRVINDQICYNRGGRSEWEPISETNMPPEHPVNSTTGSADLFNWKVYGLGLRGAMQGVIFDKVEYIDKFPEDMDFIYANDFGFTNDPNATVKYSETATDIYIELLLYQSVETPDALDEILGELGFGLDRTKPFPMDSSDKFTAENKGTVEMVRGMRKLGWYAYKIRKTKSIMYWLLSMKSKRVNIVKNRNVGFAKKEAENYTFKEIQGILVNVPNDKHNHMWDAARYAHMAWNTPSYEIKGW